MFNFYRDLAPYGEVYQAFLLANDYASSLAFGSELMQIYEFLLDVCVTYFCDGVPAVDAEHDNWGARSVWEQKGWVWHDQGRALVFPCDELIQYVCHGDFVMLCKIAEDQRQWDEYERVRSSRGNDD